MANTTNPLSHIKNFDQLIRYLEDELDWPCEQYGFNEITFQYKASDLGIKEEEATQIKSIHQLRPFFQGQPWGIFFIEFEKKRIPVVLLRRVLSHLVIKKRASANQAETAAWNTDNLLFISAFGEVDTESREIAFAHFHQEQGDLPTLRVLGWDGADTVLKMDYVAKTLQEKLHWPANPRDVNSWREQWTGAFLHKPGFVIKTANALAERMAELARGIRDAAQTLMAHETEKGRLRSLHKAFQTALIHDLSEADFADTYAQTITYGLLTAAISRTDMNAGKYGTALVVENVTDMVPITNPFLRDMLKTFLQAGGRKGGIDFDELGIQDVVDLLRGEETDLPAVLRDFGNRAPGEDPVIHFYEHFLSAYNKKLKIKRGVFYTPRPVVSYIVRSVHELLQTEFGLEDGLAAISTWGEMIKLHPEIKLPQGVSPDAPFVVVLDPATGTATFLVEVIDVVYKTMVAKWKKQDYNAAQITTAWNEYVPKHLLPRLYGFELMMAPYAIAHMKIGLKLNETGYRFGSDERVHVYLTNSLEEPSPLAEQSTASMFEALGHEAQAVNEVKRSMHFTIVIGNPPYSISSTNKSKFIEKIVEEYKEAVRGEKNVQPLSDDYIKFLGFSEKIIKDSGIGILGMITNHGYLYGIVHRGMREHLLKNFGHIEILDLHGNTVTGETGKEKTDQNVFDIQQGVSIIIASSRTNKFDKGNFFSELFGLRDAKYYFLSTRTIFSTDKVQLTVDPPYYFFRPKDFSGRGDYERFIPMSDIFRIFKMGIQFGNVDFVTDFDITNLKLRIKRFFDPRQKERELASDFGLNDMSGWTLSRERKSAFSEGVQDNLFTKVTIKPFDDRWTYYSKRVMKRPVFEVMSHMLKPNIALVSTRHIRADDYAHFFVTRNIVGKDSISMTDMCFVFPLYLYPDNYGIMFSGERSINFKKEFIQKIRQTLSLDSEELNIDDIFNYMYAIFHSPIYRSLYAEFLKIDFPRLPLTSNIELFREMCALGKELVALHLLESPLVNDPHWESPVIYTGGEPSSPIQSGYPKFDSNTVMINEAEGFKNIPEDVWNFHIGGYQVCHKWLKDRLGRQLSSEDIAHYKKIVYALGETIRLMGEVDAAIESAGGWPIK